MPAVPLNLLKEMSKLHTDKAWLWTYELTTAQGLQVIRLVNNEEAITWGDRVFEPYPIKFDVLETNNQGDLPRVRVSVSNVYREAEAIVEQHGGFEDDTITIRVLHENFLSDGIQSINFGRHRIDSVESGVEAVTFNLAPAPAFDEDFPKRRYTPRCTAKYQDPETCQFPRQEDLGEGIVLPSTCDYTLYGPNGCRFHGDMLREQGISNFHPTLWNGFRVAKR